MKKTLRTILATVLLVTLVMGCVSFAGAEGADDKFYIYSFNSDFEKLMTLVYERYPELKDKIVVVNTGASDVFQEKIDALLKTPDAEDYPDMFTLEGGFIMKYANSDYTMDVTKAGVTEEDMADMYPYTLDLARDPRDNSVKALSWQACPGAFYYNTEVAEKYLGVTTPEEMAAAISGWDNFLATARKLNEASEGQVKILSSNDDVYYLFTANKENPWVDESGVFHDDPMVAQYMETVKTLTDEKLTWNTASWGEEWYASMDNGNVLGYFGPTWFASVMTPNVKDTMGKWAICSPTVPYYWGGTWLSVSGQCTDLDTARKVLSALTFDDDAMYELATTPEISDFCNNKTALAKVSAEGKGARELTGDQDYFGFFASIADSVDVSFVSAYDTKANELIRVQVAAYANGEKSLDQATMDFEDAFAEAFPSVKFE